MFLSLFYHKKSSQIIHLNYQNSVGKTKKVNFNLREKRTNSKFKGPSRKHIQIFLFNILSYLSLINIHPFNFL